MNLQSLLIANRGEIAIRVARSAADLGLRTVTVYSEDDARSLHVKKCDLAIPLRGRGPKAYLDLEQILDVACRTGCDAVHPGYGFLSESAALAQACANRGLNFVGPPAEVLALWGDKAAARRFAENKGVDIVRGTDGGISASLAEQFLASLPLGSSMMLKAVAGGGGRGMRTVACVEDVREAYQRCRAEATASFGNGALYAEQLLERVRHVEVQILADRHGAVTHFGERECSLQRRQQKLVEIAPCPSLAPDLREALIETSLRLARDSGYQGLGTFEFLVDLDDQRGRPRFTFIEANPRLQVEHTVTEMVSGVDLVRLQLEVAAGRSLAELGVEPGRDLPPQGFAVQMRINAETYSADGQTRPASGTITSCELPSGPQVRVDTAGYVGYEPNPDFDSLLAKLIVHSLSPNFAVAVSKAYRALCEVRIEGVATNVGLLQNLLSHASVQSNSVHIRFLEEHARDFAKVDDQHRARYFVADASLEAAARSSPKSSLAAGDLLAVAAPMRGTVVALSVTVGDRVRIGQEIGVLDAMKMQHVVAAQSGGTVRDVLVAIGQTIAEGEPLAWIEPIESASGTAIVAEDIDLDRIRPDLEEVRRRHWHGTDEARPEAVARRHAKGQRTARENIDDMADSGSFMEYGALTVAAQRSRRSEDDLIKNTSGDGLLTGIATVNAAQFGPERARCLLIIGDYTVLAGTQGYFHHRKLDRAVEIAERCRLPVIVLPEGGGGRPGDVDPPKVSGLATRSFANFAKLSGQVPIVSVVAGYCFAGSAVLAGCADVIIATRDCSLGMAGPAMIEGGGLGAVSPDDVGPLKLQAPNGVIDVVVADEQEGCRVAKQYLAYFQGAISTWSCDDQRRLRHLVPENRIRSYDIRSVIACLADAESVLELRKDFGSGMVTALARIEGKPIGLIANNPRHLGGAIDADAADKAARFMQLCDAFGLPILSLCDTPGFMVGPDAERTALVRHVSRMFVTGAAIRVPFLTIVVRKAYGLGAQAMAGGSIHESLFSVAWPSGEFGPMGLEGAVRLGFRKELEAIDDPQLRQARFEELVAQSYQRGRALNVASYFEIDAVIDPADTRRWIVRMLASLPPLDEQPRRGFVDTW